MSRKLTDDEAAGVLYTSKSAVKRLRIQMGDEKFDQKVERAMTTITTTIKREFLAAIIAGTKKKEYREVKPYWFKRLAPLVCPFKMRLINGMSKKAPEVTVRIDDVIFNPNDYELLIGKVLSYKNWNKRLGKPA